MSLRTLFRWSLRTQVLAMLFAGYGLILWEWREPWRYDGEIIDGFATRPVGTRISPGRTRIVEEDMKYVIVFKVDAGYPYKRTNLQFLPVKYSSPRNSYFLNDDTIEARLNYTTDLNRDIPETYARYIVYKRRFPETWWGHFYRPEVWFLPLWLGLIVWTLRKDRAVQA